jgi:uncharacterized membrane protein
MPTRGRRGAQAVELALTLPLFAVILSGVADYGWYFRQQFQIVQVAQVGARTAASTDADDAPALAGEAALAESLAAYGFDAGGAAPSCELRGSAPDIEASCAVVLPFVALVGLVPVPDHLGGEVVMRFEDQDT